MTEPTGVTASAVNKASSGDVVILVPTLHPVLRYPSMVLIVLVWFWQGFIKFLINIAVPSTFVPTNTQRLKAAIAARKRAQGDHGLSRSSSNGSLLTLVDPGSPLYSLVPDRSHFGVLDITGSDDDFELPPLAHVPPAPEVIKRWEGLSFEQRRKIHVMSANGLNWMKWDTAIQPLPSTRVRDLPKGIPEWSEEWSYHGLPENPEYVPTSDDLRRWWGEATEQDRARINRICVEGLNWRQELPAPQPLCDENNVVLAGIGTFAELDNDHGDCPEDLLSTSTDLPPTTRTTHGNGNSEQQAL